MMLYLSAISNNRQPLKFLRRDEIRLGMYVLVKWTANFNNYEALSEVYRINQANFDVRLIERVANYQVGNPIHIKILQQTKGNCLTVIPVDKTDLLK